MSFVLVGLVGSAAAQDYEYSASEQIGFAFYKLGGATPPFDKWIAATEGYKAIALRDRAAYVDAQRKRLRFGFDSYDPETDLIHVKVEMAASVPPASAEEISALGNIRPLKMRFAGMDGPYMPHYLGGEWIAAVPQNFDRLEYVGLQQQEFNLLNTALRLDGKNEKIVPAYMILRPVRADMSAPMKFPKTHAWLLGVDIVSFEIWNEDKSRYLWGYHADGFTPNEQKELLELYRN